MKPDEIRLLLALAAHPLSEHVLPDDLVDELGIHWKRAQYILEKWVKKGWYNYGVNVFFGWLEPAGYEAARLLASKE